jgi:SAM-dependent methyltransferase
VRQSASWAAWARRPNFDAYWTYSAAFFRLVPPPGRRTLEVGCGEGRVSRDLVERGHRVIGIDTSPTLIRLASDADPRSWYLRADGAALPFADESFDLLVFYNSLMDFDDFEGSVREAARVLRRGGTMCACVTHPIADAGRFESGEAESPFVIEGAYLGPRRWFSAEVEREGLRMHFAGWSYSLEHYFGALERAGFVIQAVREPAQDEAAVENNPSDERWRRIPNFLMWRALKA